MRATGPLVIVTLPSRSLDEVRAELGGLPAAGADAAEVRIDRLPVAEQDRLAQLFPAPLPLVATYRSTTEGGGGAVDPSERARRFHDLARLPFAFIDLEPARDSTVLAEWARDPPGARLILSRHLPAEAPTDTVRDSLRADAGDGAIVKVIVPATLTRFYRDLRSLVDGPTRTGGVVFHTTAASGPILRARAGAIGLAAVYAAPPGPAVPTSEDPLVEPAQIPVDGLVPYLRSGDAGRLFALLGHPVAHSISPRMHTTWYRRLGLAALFVALDVESAEEFREVLEPLRQDGFVGFNVTHPWKGVAMSLAVRASDDARDAGCANTLTWEDGGWTADNFDVPAVVRRLQELEAQGTWSGKDALVLGSGGAARAALVALRRLEVPTRILARRREAREALAHTIGGEVESSPDRPASLIVHATPVGRGLSAPLDLPWESHARTGSVLLDFVYAPDHPVLRETMVRRGGSYEDGGRLLVYQAIEAHRRWWGAAPGEKLVDEAMREVGCAA